MIAAGMNGSTSDSLPVDVATHVARALLADGFAVVARALPAEVVAQLAQRVDDLERARLLQPAAVGRAANRMPDPALRGDRIRWLDGAAANAAERALLDWLEALRMIVNRETLLGLFEFEGHYALYPPGHGYGRHRDRFVDDDARTLSCVLYLNADWHTQHGGALRLHVDETGRAIDVPPRAGTFVAFLSDRFDHEVLPATRTRASIAGWFRRRAVPAQARC
jgi:SM-20-related protein